MALIFEPASFFHSFTQFEKNQRTEKIQQTQGIWNFQAVNFCLPGFKINFEARS